MAARAGAIGVGGDGAGVEDDKVSRVGGGGLEDRDQPTDGRSTHRRLATRGNRNSRRKKVGTVPNGS